jgi:hypothetical protein
VSEDKKQKGEYAISVAIAGVVLLTLLFVRSDWQLTSLQDVASSAEEFIFRATGIGGRVPDIAGYESVRIFRLGPYRAGLYRANAGALLFAPGHFVIYNSGNQPVFRLDTLEGAKEPWTALYDFSGRLGLPVPGSHKRPIYTRNLVGNGDPEIVVGQYSGGEHCCTTATIVELGKKAVRSLGHIDGIDGLPFEGVEFRKPDRDSAWEIIAHRGYQTLCDSPQDAADFLSLYSYKD